MLETYPVRKVLNKNAIPRSKKLLGIAKTTGLQFLRGDHELRGFNAAQLKIGLNVGTHRHLNFSELNSPPHQRFSENPGFFHISTKYLRETC